MKKKGFTLIELLAVIVILAIIALIAVPIILNIIGSSKKSAVVRSGELYLKAVETAIARENLDNQFNPTTCVIGIDGNLTCDGDKTLIIEVNGSKPTSGTINLSKGKITSVENMILDGNELKKEENGKLKLIGQSTEEPSNPDDGKIICTNIPNPQLFKELTPIIYENNNWKVADTSTKWYNYCNQEWANAVILKEGVSKNVGDTVDVSNEIKGMFVWIPRYEYKIEGQYGKGGISATSPGEVEVNFISKETTTASIGYRVHPAFTFGSEQLSGIWVGKFETTGTAESPTILPNVKALGNQNISTQFSTAQIFNTYVNNSSLDFHMSKNSEWGAVAYLSQSKYGKYGNENYTGSNKEIMINNCSSIITGVGADSQDASASSTTCTTNTYETLKGQAASTTGNITGIYDMNGGAFERVMGFYNLETGNSGFIELPNPNYYDLYTGDYDKSMAISCNGGICYGHALSETAGWYNDYIASVVSEAPWLIRGGAYASKSTGGIFNFSNGNSGGASEGYSFRVVLVGD